MTFAARLQQLRARAGMTQAALAAESGLSLGTIRDYEQGNKVPTLKSAVQLARALGTDCRTFADCEDVAEEKPKRPTKRKGK
jgi:transcriptional regulator with XRE-family HTH domain